MTISRLATAVTLSLLLLVDGAAQESESPPAAEARRPEGQQAEPPQDARDEPRTLEEIFIPSEEIAADEEVTFPIDI